MDSQLTIPNRYHYTTVKQNNRDNEGTKTLEEQGKAETNTHPHQRKQCNNTRSQLQITKTIVVTGQVQEILTHIKNGDKHTRDTEQFTLVTPKKRMTTL